MNADNLNRQWRRIAVQDAPEGFFRYKNVGTDKLLGHYVGELMQARDNGDALSNEHCQ